MRQNDLGRCLDYSESLFVSNTAITLIPCTEEKYGTYIHLPTGFAVTSKASPGKYRFFLQYYYPRQSQRPCSHRRRRALHLHLLLNLCSIWGDCNSCRIIANRHCGYNSVCICANYRDGVVIAICNIYFRSIRVYCNCFGARSYVHCGCNSVCGGINYGNSVVCLVRHIYLCSI